MSNIKYFLIAMFFNAWPIWSALLLIGAGLSYV